MRVAGERNVNDQRKAETGIGDVRKANGKRLIQNARVVGEAKERGDKPGSGKAHDL